MWQMTEQLVWDLIGGAVSVLAGWYAVLQRDYCARYHAALESRRIGEKALRRIPPYRVMYAVAGAFFAVLGEWLLLKAALGWWVVR